MDEFYDTEEFDEFEGIPTQVIERQLEVAETLIKEWEKVYKKLHKLHSNIFTYAPDVLDWGTGDAMSCVDGELEEQIKYLKSWYKGMKKVPVNRRGKDNL